MAEAVILSCSPSYILSSSASCSSPSSSQTLDIRSNSSSFPGCTRLRSTYKRSLASHGCRKVRREDFGGKIMASVTPVEEAEEGTTAATPESKPAPKVVPPGGCQACGRESVMGGCNGEGRIQGGIGAIPLFAWWPIKAYRPCPEFTKAGGKYKRQGQSLDEVAFGRAGKADNLDISERFRGGKSS